MTEARHREYGKASKRMDRRLRKIVESELDALRHDPRRGPSLGGIWQACAPFA